jgi:hypothetical protein
MTSIKPSYSIYTKSGLAPTADIARELAYYIGAAAQNRRRTRKYEQQGAYIRTPRLSSSAVSLRAPVIS